MKVSNLEHMVHCVRYLTHPQVRIDPLVPVPEWRLSDVGRARAELFARADCLKSTVRIISSGERKAVETAEIIAAALALAVEVHAATHENDRSGTGFLPPPAFELAASQFFANPNVSFCGWERAVDAQARVARAVNDALAQPAQGDILIVGHGAVGTLLLCQLAGLPIDRRHDQIAGGGNVFAFRICDRAIVHAWQPLEGLL
jgi:broad specificity phosphatase PhoE